MQSFLYFFTLFLLLLLPPFFSSRLFQSFDFSDRVVGRDSARRGLNKDL